MKQIIGSDPSRWVVQFDSLGWSITTFDGECSILVTIEQAYYAMGAIKRASAICAMPVNLKNV